MKVGFCTMNYSAKPLDEVVKIAAEAGYEAVEIPAFKDNGQTDLEELLAGGAARVKKMVADSGLFISGISNHADTMAILGYGKDVAHLAPGDTPEEQNKWAAERLIMTGQLANELEVPVVISFTGIGSMSHMNVFPYPNGWAEEEENFVERFMPILDRFKEYGVKLAIEGHPNNIIYDVHSARRAVELTGNHPCFGINFDPANLLYTGVSVEAFIDELQGRIFAVHAKDCQILPHNMPRGGYWMFQGDWGNYQRSFRFRIPGWGSVDWKSVISELYLTGYDGVFSYEHEDVTMSTDDGVEKTIAYLKPLMIKKPYEGRQDKLFTK